MPSPEGQTRNLAGQHVGKRVLLLVLSYIGLSLLICLDGQLLAHGTLSRLYFLPVLLVSWYGNRNAFAGILLCATSAIALRHSSVWVHPAASPFVSLLDMGSILLYGATAILVRNRMDEEMIKARIDPLTGIYNRRGFEEEAEVLCSNMARQGRAISLAYIDIDNFKLLNDTLGHQQGDNLLQNVAKTIQHSFRSTDVVARLGGDEFIVMVPGAGTDEVKMKLNQLRASLGELFDRGRWPVSASIGAVTFTRGRSIQHMISRADAVMYAVKRGSKDGLKYEITRGERVTTAVERD